jgi:hypothetical protein
MPSTYTQNLGLEKPATGEQAGTWGNTANNDYDFIDAATDGNEVITLSASSYQLNTQQGAVSQGRAKVIIWTGTLTQQTTVNITPNTAQKLYLMTNNTTGGFPIVFQQGTGGTFTLQPGYSAIIYCDGAGSTAKVAAAQNNGQFGSIWALGNLTVNGTLTLGQPSTFTQPVTFSNSVTASNVLNVAYLEVNTPGYTAANSDIYYRSSGGYLVPLAIGSVGQALTVASGGYPAWSTIGASIGSTIPGSTAYAIYYADPNNHLEQTSVYINPGVGLGIGAIPSHGLYIGQAIYPEIWLDTANPAGQDRRIVFSTSGAYRWDFFAVAQAESDGNTGSNLAFNAWTDDNTSVQTVLALYCNSGNVTIGSYSDMGAKLAVLGANASQPTVIVRGASSQQYLQQWQNSAGQNVAWIDSAGNFFLAAANFLQLNSAGLLDLWGTVPGHPLGTIHLGIGNNKPPFAMPPSIVFETGSFTSPSVAMPVNAARLYFHSIGSGGGYLVIQFYYNGSNFYASMPLVGGYQTGVTWSISPNAL